MNKLLYVVNTAEYFVSHRIEIAREAQRLGFEIHVASSTEIYNDSNSVTNASEVIEQEGFTFHEFPLRRGGQNPAHELYTFFKLVKLMRKISPNIVHLVTIKPVIYGGIAAQLTGVKAVVSAVAGLGRVFVADSIFAGFRRWLVSKLLALAFAHPNLKAIFQNPDDRKLLIERRIIKETQSVLIRGSGVDLSNYQLRPEPEGKPVVVMASRLLKDKGVLEFVRCAKIIHTRGFDVEFRLIGAPDPDNPSSVTVKDIEGWCAEGFVSVLGYKSDIPKQYSAAHIVCLPSYREGLPKALVEAAASGRAVITSDVPGCRFAIEPEVTGLLVPVRNSEALADAVQRLVSEPEIRKEMGLAGRALAEKEFNIVNIVHQHISIYKELQEIA